jgi:peptidoglycan/xylan/chitin deacetylase (PgdA/CDA1 family)
MLKRSIPILMYHLVTPRTGTIRRKYRVTPRQFAAQMRWLALAGYSPVTLDALHAGRAGRIDLPARPVVITFDDGCRDCYAYAVPILQARRFTAVFFLVTGLMDGVAEWLIDRWNVELEMMSWREAQQLAAAGFQCGSHTMTHVHLAEVDTATCRRELCESHAMLEDRLGGPAPHLAYPFGSFDERVRDLAAECGYLTACTTRIGLSTSADDALALRRVPVNGEDSLLDFAWRLRLGHNVHDTFQVAKRRMQRSLRLRQAQVVP